MRNMKVFGLAMMAVFAMGAIVASAAYATAAEFHVDIPTGKNAVITGTTSANHKFTVKSGAVKCTSTAFDGTVKEAEKTTTTITLKPTYSGCTTAGVKSAIETNKCGFLFHAKETLGSANEISVLVDVECEKAGEGIEVKPEGCVIKVPPQTGLTGIVLTNTGTEAETSKRDVDATINVGSIKYTETGGSCASPGEHLDGKYEGTTTLEAYEDTSTASEPYKHSETQYGLFVT